MCLSEYIPAAADDSARSGRKARNKQPAPQPYVERKKWGGSSTAKSQPYEGEEDEKKKPLSRRQNKKAKILAANGGVKPASVKAKGKKRARDAGSDDEGGNGQDSDEDDEGLAAARQYGTRGSINRFKMADILVLCAAEQCSRKKIWSNLPWLELVLPLNSRETATATMPPTSMQ